MNEHFETFSRFLHYLALYINQTLKCNYQPTDFYYLVNPPWLVCQDELQRRRLFRLLLRLRGRGAAPRCFQQHPLISKASSATANTLPDILHKDRGVCLSQAEQQMMLKDGNSRPGARERGKKSEQPQERGCLAVTHRAQALGPCQYFSLDQKHFGSKSTHSISPCCNSHHGTACEFNFCQISRQAQDLLSLQLQAFSLHEAELKPTTCSALVYRLAPLEPHSESPGHNLTGQLTPGLSRLQFQALRLMR